MEAGALAERVGGPDESSPSRSPRASESLLGGAAILAVGRYANAALGFIGTVIIVRELSQHAFGEYSFVFSIMAIVGLVADLRLSREVLVALFDAGEEAGSIVGSYVGLRLVIGVASYGVLLVVVILGGYPRSVVLTSAIGGLMLILLSAANAVRLLYEARLWMRSLALAQLAASVVQLVVVVVLAATHTGTIETFMTALVVGSAVTLIYLLIDLRGVANVRPRFAGHQWWPWLREAAPLSLGVAIDTIYFRIDMVMLSLMGTFTATGLYGVGYKFSDILGAAVPWAVLAPALTLMVKYHPADLARFHKAFRHTMLLLIVAGVAAGVGFGTIAGNVVRIVYGSRYTAATAATVYLVIGQVLHFFTSLCVTTLMAVKRNVLYPIAMAVGLVVNIVLNLIVIPRYSYTGAAVDTIVTEVVVLVLLVVGVSAIDGVRPFPWTPTVKVLTAGAVMFAVVMAVKLVLPWWVAGLGGGMAFLGFLEIVNVDGPGGLRRLLDREIVEPGDADLATALTAMADPAVD